MAERPDHYKILQVDPEADPEVIQAAYRRLAQKYHPDLTSDAEAAARMTSINAAWETLRDPLRRAGYDRERETIQRRTGARRFRPSSGRSWEEARLASTLPSSVA